ncbi:glycosyltransferase family 87 protein [Nitrospira sp. Nam74]
MMSLLTPGRLRAVNLLCLAAIVVYAGWYTCSFQIRHHAFGPSDLLDYALNYERSLLVAEQLSYPPWSSGFLYPPPNLVVRLALGHLGLEASAVLWMAMLIAATVGSIEISLYLLGLSNHPTKYLIGLLALGSVSYYFEWDLKYLNGNVLYLISVLGALVLLSRANLFGASFLLALSMVLKVYSAVFLPYCLLKRQFRLCLMTVAWLGLFFLALPAFYFGAHQAVTLTSNWIQMVFQSGNSMTLPFELAAYVMSWHKTLLTFLNATGGKGVYNILVLQQEEVLSVTRTAQVLWLALLSFYWWQSWRRPMRDTRRALTMDAATLMLSLLPFSPALQPHHGVVMLIPAMLLVGVASDATRPRALRSVSAAILLVCYFELQYGPSLALRGLGMMCTLLLFMSGLILIRSHGDGGPSYPQTAKQS